MGKLVIRYSDNEASSRVFDDLRDNPLREGGNQEIISQGTGTLRFRHPERGTLHYVPLYNVREIIWSDD